MIDGKPRLSWSLGCVLLTSAFFVFGACEPEPPARFEGTACFDVRHHGVPVRFITVYRSLGEEFPGYGPGMSERFDTAIELAARSRVCFEGLALGTHWFAGLGYDETLGDSIRGSKRVQVDNLTPDFEGELSVSERH